MASFKTKALFSLGTGVVMTVASFTILVLAERIVHRTN
jgi:hypothetical protein